MSTKHLQVRVLLTALLPLLFIAPGVTAQSRSISNEVVSAQSVNDAARERIASYVQSLLQDVRSAEPTVRQRARDAMLDPLQRPRTEASRAFRREYDRALDGALSRMIESDSIGVAITAAQIAGPLATQGGYTALMEGLDDDRPGVRYASAKASGAMLSAVDREVAVIAGQQVDMLLSKLEDVLATEQEDVLVVLGVMQGLTAPENDLRSRALTTLARGMSQQIQSRRRGGSVAPEVVNTALTTIVTIRQELISQAASGSPNRDFARQAVILAGHAMALVGEIVGNPAQDQAGADSVTALGVASEGVALLAHEALTGARFPGQIQRAIESARRGDRAALERVVNEWVGARGRLTQAPYNVGADEFGD